jgi:hypothetical protein
MKKYVATELCIITNSIKHVNENIFPNSSVIFTDQNSIIFKNFIDFFNKAKYYTHISSQKYSTSTSETVLIPTL